MKPKNFPARKLQRQINAQRGHAGAYTPDELAKLAAARDVRTKKYRGSARTLSR